MADAEGDSSARRHYLTDQEKAKIYWLAGEKKSCRQIAEIVGCKKSNVSRLLRAVWDDEASKQEGTYGISRARRDL